ncbi:MAG: hypothetical protein HYX38_32705 [Rhodospirillales bacterium]|nr:hypothetical protein [Rhodospirillales bacterium]
MSTVEAADAAIAEISRLADKAEAQIRPVYIKNKKLAFLHDVGLTALGAFGTVFVGLQSMVSDDWQPWVKAVVLLTTAMVTIFAACNQFFKFKSLTDACHLALRDIYDVRDQLALVASDQAKLKSLTDEHVSVLRQAIQKALRDADLPRNWPMRPFLSRRAMPSDPLDGQLRP